jgi:DNA primase catalytic core
VLGKVDIVRVIGRYVNLKRRGSQYVGLCPFHKEKNPSFYVDPDKGVYHCFGCGASGNVITFLAEIEGISKAEALSLLAEEFGIEIKTHQYEEELTTYKVLQEAAKYYKINLMKNNGVVDYLKGRGLEISSIAEWELGFSPDKYGVIRYLIEKGFSTEEILSSGIAINTGKEIFDRFHGRLIFPIKDITGRIVSFSGRALGEDEPKYLNGPDTKVFKKSEVLFGLDKAKTHARKEGFIYIVEGYVDAILMHQAGYKNTVAVMGTSISEDHVKSIYRFVKRVILIPDGDEAGIRSAEKHIFTLAKGGLNVQVIRLDGNMDPADYVLKGLKFPEPVDALDFLLGERVEDPLEFSTRLEKGKTFVSLISQSDENLSAFYKVKLEKWAGTEININAKGGMDIGKGKEEGIKGLEKWLLLGYAYGLKDKVLGILELIDTKNSFEHRLEFFIKGGKDFAEFAGTIGGRELSVIFDEKISKEEVERVLEEVLKRLRVERAIKSNSFDMKTLMEIYNLKKEVGV